MNLYTFEQYESVNESFNILAVLGDIPSAVRIWALSKKLTKAYTQKATNELDYQKKKEAFKLKRASIEGNDEAKAKLSDKIETLNKVWKVKDDALKTQIDATIEKMNNIGSASGNLKEYASMRVLEAKLAAAEILIKAADGELGKELEVRIDKYNDHIAAHKKHFTEYQSKFSEEEMKKMAAEVDKEKKKQSKSEKEDAETDDEPVKSTKPEQEKKDTPKDDTGKESPKREPESNTKKADDGPEQSKQEIKDKELKLKTEIQDLKSQMKEELPKQKDKEVKSIVKDKFTDVIKDKQTELKKIKEKPGKTASVSDSVVYNFTDFLKIIS